MSRCRLSQLVFLVALGSSSPSFAQTANSESHHVQAAIMLDGTADPFLGTAMCRVNEECDVISSAEPRIKLSITLNQQQDGELGTMVIQCSEDCSFVSGRSQLSLQNQRSFEIFDGAERGEIKLVLKPRRKIGDVFLIVR
ncbi:hypothetical protein DSM25558_0152 [Agrobacterium sp. DSM 25558]|uniref:hypothetical protein n=1 Tax=Agrobacterium sp. DSM 25558 TaxID=1907665 RepID=UPI000972455D|nr:hypothetical protein [Agrobacterium sp. DSM 25558]SCX00601.1 hypothetical protein DSM25558_0152 [Agrobacterium sp. DSM 25558]